MCDVACLDFGRAHLKSEDVKGLHVLEVGSADVNGSLRSWVESLDPSSYLGVDIDSGPGVDRICSAEQLVPELGPASFDVVLCTEVLEHVRDWRRVISNLKRVLRPGGVLLISTRSKGFYYHGYPSDYWRYDVEDMRSIFGDMQIEILLKDPTQPGVFLKARKPTEFNERSLDNYCLHSIVSGRRRKNLADAEIFVGSALWRLRLAIAPRLPIGLRAWLRARIRT